MIQHPPDVSAGEPPVAVFGALEGPPVAEADGEVRPSFLLFFFSSSLEILVCGFIETLIGVGWVLKTGT